MKKRTSTIKRSWVGLAAVAAIGVGVCASQPSRSDAAPKGLFNGLERRGGEDALLSTNTRPITDEDETADCKSGSKRTAADVTLQLFIKQDFFKDLDSQKVCNPDSSGALKCLSVLYPKGLKLRDLTGGVTPMDIDIRTLTADNPQAGADGKPIKTVDLVIVLDTSGGNAEFLTPENDLAIADDGNPLAPDDDDTYLAVRAGGSSWFRISCRTKSVDTTTANQSKITIRIKTKPGGTQIVDGYLNIAVLLGKGVSLSSPPTGFYLPVIIDPKVPSAG
jgi:hypothetical protein